MSSIYAKDNRLYFKLKLLLDGKWAWRALKSDFRPGQEAAAKVALAKIEAKLAAGLMVAGDMRPVTVEQFSKRWVKDREENVGTWENDEAAMRLHVLPSIGQLRLDEVRPLHLTQLVKDLRKKNVERKFADGKVRKLSPKSIHNIYGTVSAFFRDARLEDLIVTSPCILTKHQLGAKVDSNPEWRPTAIYTRAELERLISDEAVPMDRRLLYALEGVGALRHGEAAGLRFRHILPGEPLDMLAISTSYGKGRTKTSVARFMPIHPTLAAMLAEWKLHGWAEMMGRKPADDDLVVPLEPTSRRPGQMRKKENSWRRLTNDLLALGMRHRRGHDLRRTMISLARTDGARSDILRRGTHKPPKEVIEGYTTFEWDVLCREVAKLKIQRTKTGEVISMPMAAAGGGNGDLGTELGTASGNLAEFHDNPEGATRIRTGDMQGGSGESSAAKRGFSGLYGDGAGDDGHENPRSVARSRNNVPSASVVLSAAEASQLEMALRMALTRAPGRISVIQAALALLVSGKVP